MKKTISVNKNVEFPTMIGEITAISLDQNLKFTDQSNINGDLIVYGKYKMTEASIIEEDFEYKIPIEILLTEKLVLNTTKIEIDDFYYEIENDDSLKCYIDIKIEGIEEIEEIPNETILSTNEDIFYEENSSMRNENIQENQSNSINSKTEQIEIENTANCIRECDGEKIEQQEIIQAESNKIDNLKIEEGMGSLFSSFKDSDETFSTYSVYILRQDETIESIIDKYKTNKEELEKYNDLTNLSNGTKIIIPNSNE